MKKILLSKGNFAIVDDEDFEWLNQWKWSLNIYGYAYRLSKKDKITNKRKPIFMHRIILNAPSNLKCDHINRIPLDNRRENLRYASTSLNLLNRGKNKNNTTGYKGVTKFKKWFVAQMTVNKKNNYLGSFKTAKEAAKTYNDFASTISKEFAYLNEI